MSKKPTIDATHRPVIVTALYAYLFETEHYLRGFRKGEPEATDLCCDTHKARFEEQVSQRMALLERKDEITAALAAWGEWHIRS